MIPSIFFTYAMDERKKAQRKIEFGKIAGISNERLLEVQLRKEYLDTIINQFRLEREVSH